MDLTSYIANVSMSMAQSNALNGASAAMLKKTMESAEAQGASAVNLIESASIPPAGSKGHLLDIRV